MKSATLQATVSFNMCDGRRTVVVTSNHFQLLSKNVQSIWRKLCIYSNLCRTFWCKQCDSTANDSKFIKIKTLCNLFWTGIIQWAVMPCGWEGNRIGLALHWLASQTLVVLHLRAQFVEEGDEHPPTFSCEAWSTILFTL